MEAFGHRFSQQLAQGKRAEALQDLHEATALLVEAFRPLEKEPKFADNFAKLSARKSMLAEKLNLLPSAGE